MEWLNRLIRRFPFRESHRPTTFQYCIDGAGISCKDFCASKETPTSSFQSKQKECYVVGSMIKFGHILPLWLNLEDFLSISAKFWTYFGYFFLLLGKFTLL